VNKEVTVKQAGRNILIIDDDPDVAEAARAVLQSAGYEVYWAMGGDEGLEKARELRPDLIILDIVMRTFTEGFRVGYELRKDPLLKGIPVIILSAISSRTGTQFSTEEDEDYLPGDLFLDKPSDPEELLRKVGELIDRAKK